MKSFIFIAIWVVMLFILSGSFAAAQTPPAQEYNGKVIVPSTYGDLICFGSWDAEAGRCNGPQVSSGGLAALSAMQSAGALERIQALLDTMSKTLSQNTEAVLSIENSIDRQNREAGESLRQAISKRIDAAVETIGDDAAKEELRQLKKDLLAEVDRRSVKPVRSSGE